MDKNKKKEDYDKALKLLIELAFYLTEKGDLKAILILNEISELIPKISDLK